MMRAAAALLLLMAGCTDGDAPPQLVQDLGAVVVADLAGSCTTACDCPAGLACKQGKCATAATQIFCCGTAACTSANLCEFPDGTISQCDRVDGGGTPPDVDAGATPTACAMNGCSRGVGGNAFCKLACGDPAATCVNAGGIEHCMP
jgi:hypothetical protein